MSETTTELLIEVELARAIFFATYQGEKGDNPEAKEARKKAWDTEKPEYLRTARRTIRLLEASNKISLVATAS